MMDWQTAKLEDLVFDVDVEGIMDVGPTHVFPVRVLDKEGTVVFTQGISIRSEFFRQLKETAEWESALLAILKNRVRQEILRRKKQKRVPIEDKMRLMAQAPTPLI